MADKRNSIRMKTLDKHGSMVYYLDEQRGMVGLDDSKRGPGFGKENELQTPTPSVKAFFLILRNKKANCIDQ